MALTIFQLQSSRNAAIAADPPVKSSAIVRSFRRRSSGGADFRDGTLAQLANRTATGSEFESVLLVLPTDPSSEASTRELLYTAITRARRHFLVQASSQIISSGVARLIRRQSGLAPKLGWPPGNIQLDSATA